MFASKYKGGISKNRIIKAFDFLKQRSDEAALAARREAAALRKQQEKQQAQDDADAAAAAAAEGGDGQKGEEEKSDQEVFALKRKPWEKNAKSTLPEGGAGLVSLMGDMSSLEQRIQGEWTLAIKAGGRCVWCWRLLLEATVGRMWVGGGREAAAFTPSNREIFIFSGGKAVVTRLVSSRTMTSSLSPLAPKESPSTSRERVASIFLSLSQSFFLVWIVHTPLSPFAGSFPLLSCRDPRDRPSFC